MTATITEHVPDPFSVGVNSTGNLVKAESWFDVSCDDCGWQSKDTHDRQKAARWRDMHNGARCPA